MGPEDTESHNAGDDAPDGAPHHENRSEQARPLGRVSPHDRKATEMTSDSYGEFDALSASRIRTGTTRWTGWVAFAGVMLIIGGILNAFYGLIAVLNDEWVVWGNRASVYLDISQWGWIHLIMGLVVVLAGVGVFSGNFLARSVGVIAASASLITNFAFVPAYPIWSLVVVAIDVIVIWALIAHGKEMQGPAVDDG
jgi:hypothetical protein